MAAGLTEQIERRLTQDIVTWGGEYPWKKIHRSSRIVKTIKHRRERRRAKADPECVSHYRRYCGFEW